MAMFRKPTIASIFRPSSVEMTPALRRRVKFSLTVSGRPRLSAATMWAAKSIAAWIARCRFRTKMSCLSSSSRLAGSPPVVSRIRLRHRSIAAIFASTMSRSGMGAPDTPAEDSLFDSLSDPLEIVVFTGGANEEVLIDACIVDQDDPLLQHLHSENGRRPVEDHEVDLPFHSRTERRTDFLAAVEGGGLPTQNRNVYVALRRDRSAGKRPE